MPSMDDIVTDPTTLSPLDDYATLRRGLIAVSILGLTSFILSVTLFLSLAWRLILWFRRPDNDGASSRISQFIILLFNLFFADIQQSIAFLLNIHWLSENAIIVNTSTCWAQGWFVSTGDLSSGLFTLAIALHAFLDIVCDYRFGPRTFGAIIIGIWTFNYMLPIIGIAMHPNDFYVRAGAWCWVNGKYIDERLYLHYFWMVIAEFGTVAIYALIWLVIQKRVKDAMYTTSDTLLRARSAAKVIIAYPIVFIVCTLPLVKARLTSMAGEKVSFLELTIAGAMITSNGWLDVLLYNLTRRSLLFGPDIDDAEGGILATFRLRRDQAFGTTTTIEAPKTSRMSSRGPSRPSLQVLHDRSESQDELFAGQGVKTETTVMVRNDTVEMDAMRHEEAGERETSKDTASLSSRSHWSRKSQKMKWRSGGV